MSTPRINRVFHNPTSNQTTVSYVTTENDGQDVVESVLKSKDAPLPEFLEALGALAPSICKLAELPAGYIDTVRGITLHRDPEDPDAYTVGFCATKRIEGSNSPMVLNTPAVDKPRGKRIQRVLYAAEAYLEGQRAQADLPLES